MSMVTELIKKIRDFVSFEYDLNWDNTNAGLLLKEAADTIEELSAKLHASQMERSSQYYHGGWILCGERLPEEAYGCLVTVIDTNSVTMEDFENILPYFVGYDGERWNDADGEQCPFEILAWRPLPEPYSPNEKEVEDADCD